MKPPRPPAPRLVFAIGNASRGDDALGPQLAQALRAEGWFDGAAAELIEVYQLQVEDALELAGREAVLFVDAERPPAAQDVPGALGAARITAGGGAAEGVSLRPVAAAPAPVFSHALEPGALLEVCRRVCGQPPPPASVLAIVGAAFELGAPLSAPARARLPAALALARAWLGSTPGAPSQGAAREPSTKHSQPDHSVWLG
jgi:hydrogenase maturation protease